MVESANHCNILKYEMFSGYRLLLCIFIFADSIIDIVILFDFLCYVVTWQFELEWSSLNEGKELRTEAVVQRCSV